MQHAQLMDDLQADPLLNKYAQRHQRYMHLPLTRKQFQLETPPIHQPTNSQQHLPSH
jgi:hypothetical protein